MVVRGGEGVKADMQRIRGLGSRVVSQQRRDMCALLQKGLLVRGKGVDVLIQME